MGHYLTHIFYLLTRLFNCMYIFILHFTSAILLEFQVKVVLTLPPSDLIFIRLIKESCVPYFYIIFRYPLILSDQIKNLSSTKILEIMEKVIFIAKLGAIIFSLLSSLMVLFIITYWSLQASVLAYACYWISWGSLLHDHCMTPLLSGCINGKFIQVFYYLLEGSSGSLSIYLLVIIFYLYY